MIYNGRLDWMLHRKLSLDQYDSKKLCKSSTILITAVLSQYTRVTLTDRRQTT